MTRPTPPPGWLETSTQPETGVRTYRPDDPTRLDALNPDRDRARTLRLTHRDGTPADTDDLADHIARLDVHPANRSFDDPIWVGNLWVQTTGPSSDPDNWTRHLDTLTHLVNVQAMIHSPTPLTVTVGTLTRDGGDWTLTEFGYPDPPF